LLDKYMIVPQATSLRTRAAQISSFAAVRFASSSNGRGTVAHCHAGTARPKYTSARLHPNQCRPLMLLLSSPQTTLHTRAMVLSYKVQRRGPNRPRSARPAPQTRARRGHPRQRAPPDACPQPACPSAPADSDSPWCRSRRTPAAPSANNWRMRLARRPPSAVRAKTPGRAPVREERAGPGARGSCSTGFRSPVARLTRSAGRLPPNALEQGRRSPGLLAVHWQDAPNLGPKRRSRAGQAGRLGLSFRAGPTAS
jgi:hypothetical protein